MNKSRKTVPKAIQEAMQGLAFWIGYQHRLFPDHDLVEGAVVSELYRLLARHSTSDNWVIPECAYSRFSKFKATDEETRADILVALRGDNSHTDVFQEKNKVTGVEYVLEIKRSNAPVATLKSDIRRLHECLKGLRKEERAFLIVVSQAAKPQAIRGFGSLVNSNGTASRSLPKSISAESGVDIPVHVCRVCKATSTFNSKRNGSAHYVVLIEVLRR
jgi:hypothetical protein